MIPKIEECLAENRNFILAPVFEMRDVMGVDINKIKEMDPDLKCLININTEEDLKRFRITGG